VRPPAVIGQRKIERGRADKLGERERRDVCQRSGREAKLPAGEALRVDRARALQRHRPDGDVEDSGVPARESGSRLLTSIGLIAGNVLD
jgi:hypothetical protein